MMDAGEFLALAAKLVAIGTFGPAGARTAVSRAYYGGASRCGSAFPARAARNIVADFTSGRARWNLQSDPHPGGSLPQAPTPSGSAGSHAKSVSTTSSAISRLPSFSRQNASPLPDSRKAWLSRRA